MFKATAHSLVQQYLNDHQNIDPSLRDYMKQAIEAEVSGSEGTSLSTLAQMVVEGNLAKKKLTANSDAQQKDISEEKALKEILRKSNRAKQEIMERKLCLIISAAIQNDGKGVPLEDLIQEGSLVLANMLDELTPAWTRSALLSRMNVEIYRGIESVVKEAQKSAALVGTDDEVARYFNGPGGIHYCYEDELIKRIEAPTLTQILNEAISTLSDVEQKLLAIRFSDEQLTTRDVAEQAGVQRKTADRIGKKALQNLRNQPALTKILWDYL